jgi:hypothetical protein
MDSRFAPLAIDLALLAVLLMASEAIFSFFFFHPLASAIAVWSLIGLGGGGALVYYAFIEPRRKPTHQAPDVETKSSPD